MSETPTPTGVKRRDFLKILGTTTAVAGCNTDDPGKLTKCGLAPEVQHTSGLPRHRGG